MLGQSLNVLGEREESIATFREGARVGHGLGMTALGQELETAAAIVEAARQRNCDLIFMASHGRRGLAALLLGSETQKVLVQSQIPVLVYR